MNRISAVIFVLTTWLSFSVSQPASAQYRTDTGYSDLDDSETAASMRRHVSEIASAENLGRKAGSDGEKDAASYVFGVLQDYGVGPAVGRGQDGCVGAGLGPEPEAVGIDCAYAQPGGGGAGGAQQDQGRG